MCLAKLLTKLQREEQFSDEDWEDVTNLTCTALVWLYDNSRIPHESDEESTPAKLSNRKKAKTRR
jgi:hypothetical protein